MARVLVTDARLGSAVAIIRSLGRRGHEVIAADSEPRSAGFHSRYATDRLRHPSPADDPDAAAEALLRAVEERGVDLVIPVTDDVILPISQRRGRFERTCVLALPDAVSLARTRDKKVTLELAQELGVPLPRTTVVQTVQEAREEAARLGWPVVLKPQASRVYRRPGEVKALSVAYAGGFARLDRLVEAFEGRPVLLQEYYGGEAYGVDLLTYRGRPLAAFQHRRLREVPMTGGASSFRESVPLDPILLDFSLRILGALGWTGLAMVEFKVGPEGPRLMEVNGRVWGSLPLATKSGVDLPALAADLHLDPAAGPEGASRWANGNGAYPLGVRSRNLELEVVWIASVLRGDRRYPFLPAPRRREALRAAARLALPADGYDILSLDDPLAGIADLVRIGGRLRRKLSGAC